MTMPFALAGFMEVEQKGGIACHTGRRSCFFNRLDSAGHWEEVDPVLKDPKDIYK